MWNRAWVYFLYIAAAASLFGIAVASESTMEPIPEAKNIITEIWCVEGHKFLYVEKTTNDTFQFFQLTRNGGMAPKVIECDGTEAKKVP